MGCLDNDALLGFVEGRSSPEEIQRIEEHIDACEACRRLVSELAEAMISTGGEEDTTRPASPQTPGSPGEAPPLASGTLVDHYRVLQRMGQGGMGEVYLAEDTQLGRQVALKLIRTDLLCSRKAVERFLFEARATALFSHPNIVGIYGVGEHGERPYVALELIRGQPLTAVVGTLPAPRVVQIALGIAEALAEAHRHGLLHRDLKPSNVIISPDGRARVLDFGIAKALPEPTADEGLELEPVLPAGLATAGFVGTPGYAAPEQWRGAEASTASDVYALGMVLYELLVGFHPFRGSADGRVPPVVVGGEIIHRTPTHPSLAELVPLALACLSRVPADRPSVPEVVQALRRWTRRHDTVALPAVRRRAMPIVVAVAAVAVLAVGGVIVWRLGTGGGGSARPSSAGADAASARRPALERTSPASVAPAPDSVVTVAPARPARTTRIKKSASRKRRRGLRAARRKGAAKPAASKPEPINLDAPFPPQ